jgi:hypothetical protein
LGTALLGSNLVFRFHPANPPAGCGPHELRERCHCTTGHAWKHASRRDSNPYLRSAGRGVLLSLYARVVGRGPQSAGG